MGLLSAELPATAAPADQTTAALAPCVDAAKRSGAAAWTCTAAGLTVEVDGVRAFTPIAPAVPARVEEARVLDDYDGWCENGSVCHRVINDYIAETKGNAAYGNQEGVIGTFDVVLRTVLNGRQAQWRVALIRDSGPLLQFTSVQVTCWEEVNLLPDNSCGVHGAGAPTVQGRWDSNTLYGNKLASSNEYYGAVNGEFTPAGHPGFTMGTLEGEYFNCYGEDNCYYA
ncbi:hypothetical protein [Lentzea sp. NPDC003310]|uniref:hypothetical protein n=1 Tax=Lentzea sp. NPDC003310 TaxID=3154447 RepID=UPI0033A24B70